MCRTEKNHEIETQEECPVKALDRRLIQQRRNILRDYIIQRGQVFGRMKYNATFGRTSYLKIGGDDIHRDLPENGELDLSNVYNPAGGLLVEKP